MKNIVLRLSTGSETSQELKVANGALGGKMAVRSSGSIPFEIRVGETGNNVLWDNISADENIKQIPEYRCVYVYNDGSKPGARQMIGIRAYVSDQTYADYEIAVLKRKNSDAETIPNETTAPSEIQFATYTRDAPLDIGDLSINERVALWIKRTPRNVGGTGEMNETFSLILEGSQ